MSESKVYMFPESGYDRGHDTALWATLANNQNNGMNSMWPMMAMNGGMNGMWNNPFIYLVWMMFAQRMWGGNGFGGFGGGQGLQDVEIQSQLSGLREQLNTNQNTSLLMDAIKGNGNAVGQLASQLNCDFNTLNSAICDVRGSVDKVAGQVGFSAERVINAVNLGDAGISRQLSECCCNVRDAITRQGYENQLAVSNSTNVLQNAIVTQGYQNQLGNLNQTNTLATAINKVGCDSEIANLNQTNVLQNAIGTVATGQERGFSTVAYETQRQTCDITKAIADSTAQILAGQKAAEMRELQREIQSLRDEKNAFQSSALIQQQTQNLVNQLRPCPIPAYITCNPFGCQSDNYPYGVYNGGGSCGC